MASLCFMAVADLCRCLAAGVIIQSSKISSNTTLFLMCLSRMHNIAEKRNMPLNLHYSNSAFAQLVTLIILKEVLRS